MFRCDRVVVGVARVWTQCLAGTGAVVAVGAVAAPAAALEDLPEADAGEVVMVMGDPGMGAGSVIGEGVGIDSTGDGRLVVGDAERGEVWVVTPDGAAIRVPDTADELEGVWDVAAAEDGIAYIADDRGVHRLSLDDEGPVTQVLGSSVEALAWSEGELFLAEGAQIRVLDDAGEERTLVEDAGFGLSGLDLGPDGRLYAVGEAGVLAVDTEGEVTELLDAEQLHLVDDGQGRWEDRDIAAGDGVLHIVGGGGRLVVDPDGEVLFRLGPTAVGAAVGEYGELYLVDGDDGVLMVGEPASLDPPIEPTEPQADPQRLERLFGDPTPRPGSVVADSYPASQWRSLEDLTYPDTGVAAELDPVQEAVFGNAVNVADGSVIFTIGSLSSPARRLYPDGTLTVLAGASHPESTVHATNLAEVDGAYPAILDVSYLPRWLGMDSEGRLYAAARSNPLAVYELEPGGLLHPIVEDDTSSGPLNGLTGFAVAEDGTLYLAESQEIRSMDRHGEGEESLLKLGIREGHISEIAVGREGELYAVVVGVEYDTSLNGEDSVEQHDRILRIDPDGQVRTIAGSEDPEAPPVSVGGSALDVRLTEESFRKVLGLGVDGEGTLFAAFDTGERVEVLAIADAAEAPEPGDLTLGEVAGWAAAGLAAGGVLGAVIWWRHRARRS